MKIFVAYLIWFIITFIWSLLKDENKSQVLFRFIFTFLIFSVCVMCVLFKNKQL